MTIRSIFVQIKGYQRKTGEKAAQGRNSVPAYCAIEGRHAAEYGGVPPIPPYVRVYEVVPSYVGSLNFEESLYSSNSVITQREIALSAGIQPAQI